MLCLHHDEYTTPTGSFDRQFLSTLSLLFAAECNVPQQAVACKDPSLSLWLYLLFLRYVQILGVLCTFILVSVLAFRARHGSCILEIEILMIHILVFVLEYWIIELPLGQTTGYQVAVFVMLLSTCSMVRKRVGVAAIWGCLVRFVSMRTGGDQWLW